MLGWKMGQKRKFRRKSSLDTKGSAGFTPSRAVGQWLQVVSVPMEYEVGSKRTSNVAPLLLILYARCLNRYGKKRQRLMKNAIRLENDEYRRRE